MGHFLEVVQKFLCGKFRVDLISYQMTLSKVQGLPFFFFCLPLLTAGLSFWLQGGCSNFSTVYRHSNNLLRRGEFPLIYLLLLLRKTFPKVPSILPLRYQNWVTCPYLNQSLARRMSPSMIGIDYSRFYHHPSTGLRQSSFPKHVSTSGPCQPRKKSKKWILVKKKKLALPATRLPPDSPHIDYLIQRMLYEITRSYKWVGSLIGGCLYLSTQIHHPNPSLSDGLGAVSLDFVQS